MGMGIKLKLGNGKEWKFTAQEWEFLVISTPNVIIFPSLIRVYPITEKPGIANGGSEDNGSKYSNGSSTSPQAQFIETLSLGLC